MAGAAKYTITNPVGVDDPIKRMQSKFVSKLWTDKTWNVYPRVYITNSNIGKKPEAFIGGVDYKELFLDGKTTHCMFVVDEEREYDQGVVTANVGIIFCVKLTVLYDSLTHRADEEARSDVLNLFENEPYGFVVDNTVVNIEDSFTEFDYESFKDEMQPYHIFRINCTINYDNDLNC